jgi:hypothetical protein
LVLGTDSVVPRRSYAPILAYLDGHHVRGRSARHHQVQGHERVRSHRQSGEPETVSAAHDGVFLYFIVRLRMDL